MRLNRHITLAAFISLTLFLAFTPGAMAEIGKDKAGKKIPIVQFSSMLVPAAIPGKRAKYIAVTPLLEMNLGHPITDFCKFSARVHETILMTMHSNPVTAIKDEEVILSGDLHKQMIHRVNQASGGKEQVSKIHMLATTLIMGTGVAGRLPYATIAGCKEFRSMEDKGGVMPIE